MNEKKKKNTGKIIWVILFITAVAVFIISGVMLALSFGNFEKPLDEFKNPPTDATASSEDTDQPTSQLVPNPINFDALDAVNQDIYAWLIVPGTPIDYPVLQNAQNDAFYLKHAYDKTASPSGSLYTEALNRKDFSDPNTVIYGHYMRNGTFFGPLHEFRDADFFSQNRYFYIYTPGHMYKYEIFAAYETDNRHILYAYDFYDPQVFAAYIEQVFTPSDNKNLAQGIEIGPSDRIVTLSTCVQSGADELRYLVQGVLIEQQLTR